MFKNILYTLGVRKLPSGIGECNVIRESCSVAAPWGDADDECLVNGLVLTGAGKSRTR